MGVGEQYQLFAAMVTSRPYNTMMDPKLKRNTRVRLIGSGTKEEKQLIQAYTLALKKDIVRCLQVCNPDLLLLFKTNDFLRTIEKSLGSLNDSFYYTVTDFIWFWVDNDAWNRLSTHSKEQNHTSKGPKEAFSLFPSSL